MRFRNKLSASPQRPRQYATLVSFSGSVLGIQVVLQVVDSFVQVLMIHIVQSAMSPLVVVPLILQLQHVNLQL